MREREYLLNSKKMAEFAALGFIQVDQIVPEELCAEAVAHMRANSHHDWQKLNGVPLDEYWPEDHIFGRILRTVLRQYARRNRGSVLIQDEQFQIGLRVSVLVPVQENLNGSCARVVKHFHSLDAERVVVDVVGVGIGPHAAPVVGGAVSR